MGLGTPTGYTRPVTPRAPIAPRPDNRAGPFGASPAFPSLASPAARPKAPAAPTYTNDQVTQSLAANPHAAGSNGSLFAYQGQPQIAAAVSPPINPAPVAPVAPNVSYDYNADPILTQTKALTTEDRTNANADALSARKKIAIDFNDPTLADSLGDPGTSAAARNNPFGVLEQLKHSYDTGSHNLDEDLNNQNLFYGGHRILEQGNLLRGYQGQVSGASGQEQDLLGGVGRGLRDALLAADKTDEAAKAAAPPALGGAVPVGGDPGAGQVPQDSLVPGFPAEPPPPPPATPAGDTLPAAPIDYSLASMLFPTPNTELVNPAAFAPAADTLPQAPVPMDYSLASQLFPTANTELVNPSALGGQQSDPITQALAGLTPQQKRRIQEGF